MKVYVVLDDPPSDFGETYCVSVHQTPVGADSRIKSLKKEDEVKYQYLIRVQKELEG